MRKIAYIFIFSIIWSSSFSQSINQGQLYAGPSENAIDIKFNSTLNISFYHVDDIVEKTNHENFSTFESLAINLTQQFNDERSKVRSIYTWIALNIIYDQNALFSSGVSNQNALDVWKSRLAVCEGYANLFHEMCAKSGIESRIIKGYVKDIAGTDLRFPNHAWNSVKIDGKWQLLDVTWASINNEGSKLANTKLTNNQLRQKLDHFFLVNPSRMILTHLPEDPYWQLQNNYVNMEIFINGEDYIKSALMNPSTEMEDFEDLISNYENLDSLDRSISYLERMERNNLNKIKEYGLGISYYYKAQKILRESGNNISNDFRKAKQLARKYYKKSLDQLVQLRENDFGYEFSIDLANNVAFKMEVLQ
ncbi:MAG: hypothetical protein KAI29_16735 [Cyclobacteriaceae bacterium]|nr:hypothetical protein [Cyclobacteriaceae bacterium]